MIFYNFQGAEINQSDRECFTALDFCHPWDLVCKRELLTSHIEWLFLDFLNEIFSISPLRSPAPLKKWLFQENKYKEQRAVIHPVRYLLGAKVFVSYDVETLRSRQNVSWTSLYLFYFTSWWFCRSILCLPMQVIKIPHCI